MEVQVLSSAPIKSISEREFPKLARRGVCDCNGVCNGLQRFSVAYRQSGRMGKATYGTGTIFKRGRIWYVSFWVDGRQAEGATRRSPQIFRKPTKLRDQILGKKARGELDARRPRQGNHMRGNSSTIFWSMPHSNVSRRPPRRYSNGASRRTFGRISETAKVSQLTTKTLKEYRQKRLA